MSRIIFIWLILTSIDFIYSGSCCCRKNENNGGSKTNLISSCGSGSKPVDSTKGPNPLVNPEGKPVDVLGNKGKLTGSWKAGVKADGDGQVEVNPDDKERKRQEEERKRKEEEEKRRREFEEDVKKVKDAVDKYLGTKGMGGRCSFGYSSSSGRIYIDCCNFSFTIYQTINELVDVVKAGGDVGNFIIVMPEKYNLFKYKFEDAQYTLNGLVSSLKFIPDILRVDGDEYLCVTNGKLGGDMPVMVYINLSNSLLYWHYVDSENNYYLGKVVFTKDGYINQEEPPYYRDGEYYSNEEGDEITDKNPLGYKVIDKKTASSKFKMMTRGGDKFQKQLDAVKFRMVT